MTVYTRHGHYCVVPALGNKYANRHSVKACGASLASYKMLMSPKMCLSTLWFCFVFHFPENHSLQPKCQVLILNRALVSSLKLQEKKKNIVLLFFLLLESQKSMSEPFLPMMKKLGLLPPRGLKPPNWGMQSSWSFSVYRANFLHVVPIPFINAGPPTLCWSLRVPT